MLSIIKGPLKPTTAKLMLFLVLAAFFTFFYPSQARMNCWAHGTYDLNPWAPDPVTPCPIERHYGAPLPSWIGPSNANRIEVYLESPLIVFVPVDLAFWYLVSCLAVLVYEKTSKGKNPKTKQNSGS
jgi:hypothetical protein